MARHETGAWLPISAVVVNLVLYVSGITVCVLAARGDLPPYVGVVAIIGLVRGQCCHVQFARGVTPGGDTVESRSVYFAPSGALSLSIRCIQTWWLGRDPLWHACVWAFVVCACIWFGCREFFEARKAGRAAKATNNAVSGEAAAPTK